MPTRWPPNPFSPDAVGNADAADAGYQPPARIQESQTSVSPLQQIVLLLGTIAFVILNYPSNIDKKGVRLLVIGAIAAFVAFVFALTMYFSAHVEAARAEGTRFRRRGGDPVAGARLLRLGGAQTDGA